VFGHQLTYSRGFFQQLQTVCKLKTPLSQQKPYSGTRHGLLLSLYEKIEEVG
jgi:hypothetical protein